MTVTWRPAATYCGRFEVSSDGRVRNRHTLRQLKFHLSNGYPRFATRKGRAGRAYCYRVHTLVALAFIGPRPTCRHEINHKDGNKSNNYVSNLEWVTHSQNMQHAYQHGLAEPRRGTQQADAKLNDSLVRFIRSHYRPRCPQYGCRAIARRLGVDHSIVSNVINYRTWKHVSP